MSFALLSPVSYPLLFMVVGWAVILFCAYGLMSKTSPMSFIALLFGAIAVASGVYLILDLSSPYSGIFRASPAPLEQVLAYHEPRPGNGRRQTLARRAENVDPADRIMLGCARGKHKQAMTETPTRTQIRLAQAAVALMIAFIVVGAVWYGFSAEVRERVWQNLVDRPGGPMTFRFILQPCMAAIAALRDGVNDAKFGRAPYFWALLTNPSERGGRLREGLISTARIILLGPVHGRDLSGDRAQDILSR